jgi:hypothetical protein
MSPPQKKATPVLRKQPIIRWSGLSLHFVEAHGFFQGKGSLRLRAERAGWSGS